MDMVATDPPVAVAVVSLAVMCSHGPDKLLGAFE